MNSKLTAILFAAFAAQLLLPLQVTADKEIGFIEKFALADDRDEVLKELIPGTEEYYYYHALHYQNENRESDLKTILTQWRKRYEHSSLRQTIEHRQAIFGYEKNPKATITYIRNHTGHNLHHEQERKDTKPNLPTKLDQRRIALKEFQKTNFSKDSNLSRLTDKGLDLILREKIKLSSAQRRELLSRLRRPDYEGLVSMIHDELATEQSRGFGEFQIHHSLLVSQLDELLNLRPKLNKNPAFVNSYLLKLQPGADESLTRDDKALDSYLDRAWEFVKDLDPVFNSLKANILYQRLNFERANGRYPEATFLTYIKLPRNSHHINPLWRKNSAEDWRHPVDLNFNCREHTSFPPIGTDHEIVRDYLLSVFTRASSFDKYSPYLTESYLKATFAESKIVNGIGDSEKWASLMSPSAFAALKERVDIDLAKDNPVTHGIEDEVTLDVFIKNTPKLIVKVYEINTANYYIANQKNIGTDLNLDGLVSNNELTFEYQESPFLRKKRTFEFPQIGNERGVWVIELIGGGKSSRALIRKGQLNYVSRPSSKGNIIRILDEEFNPAPNTYAWLNGQRFDQDENGEITFPFSTNPGSARVVMVDQNGFGSLIDYQLKGETYRLDAGFHVDREELTLGRTATLAIRPKLTVNGSTAPLAILENIKLVITTTNHEAIQSTDTIEDIELFQNTESLHQFSVPPRVSKLTFSLQAKVKSLSLSKHVDVGASHAVSVNQIDTTKSVSDLFLSQVDGNWILQELGRTGEPVVDRPVTFRFYNENFTYRIKLNLKTDEKGEINLGALGEIERFQAVSANNRDYTWHLPEARNTLPTSIHINESETISLPYSGNLKEPSRAEFSLLESSVGTYRDDFYDKLQLKNGFIEISNLAAGDYDLLLKGQSHRVNIRVAAGKEVFGFAISKSRFLQKDPRKALQISQLTAKGEEIVIDLANADESTRVHLVGTRFLPEFDHYYPLSPGSVGSPSYGRTPRFINTYLSGRQIGDEYRYILDRKYIAKYPGNMLERPALLLNPWQLRDTNTATDSAKDGQEWQSKADSEAGARGSDAPAPAASPKPRSSRNMGQSYDFLGGAPLCAYNLEAKDGKVRIAKELLGDRQYIYVVATNGHSSVARHLSLPSANTKIRDLRLVKGLNPEKHFTLQKEAKVVGAGKPVTIQDPSSAEFQSYGNLATLFTLLQSINSDPKLEKFAFILRWKQLEDKEKRELYSEHACHELSFFIQRKDPEFFSAVVKSYLANKRDKTFIDYYLLDADLDRYLQPWRYGQLNIIEKILLSEKISERRTSIQRDVLDHFATLPPDYGINLGIDRALSGLAVRFAIPAETESLGRQPRPSRSRSSGRKGRELGKSVLSDFSPSDSLSVAGGVAVEKLAEMGESLGELKPGLKMAAADESKKISQKFKGLSEKRKALKELRKPGGDRPGLEDLEVSFEANFAKDIDGRANTDLQRQFYRKLEATKEWAENNYYQLPIAQQNAALVSINKFWKDYAAWSGQGVFLSGNVTEATRNFTEMMFAISVTGLPFPEDTKDSKTDLSDPTQLVFTPGDSQLLFQKEITEASLDSEGAPLLVSQNFFREGDRFRTQDGEQLDKFVTKEFLKGIVYGCQIVVTNPSSSPQNLDILTQIPKGAIPVSLGKVTNHAKVRLAPYHTHTADYYFYFPSSGTYRQFPIHVGRADKIVAFAEAFSFNVVDQLSSTDTASWAYISQFGTDQEVFDYLDQHNLHQLDVEKVAWRVRAREGFYTRLMSLLRKRHYYSHAIFAYSLIHNDAETLGDWMHHQNQFLDKAGAILGSKLISYNPVERKRYQHLEYSPLVNARSHRLGADNKILNDSFRAQYVNLMRKFTFQDNLEQEDLLSLSYYLFLQDRIEEALETFKKVSSSAVAEKLQYDYVAAYAAFFAEDLGSARQIAEKHADHPVDKWRKRFELVKAHLDEIEGKSAIVDGTDSREEQQNKLAAKMPSFDFTLQDKKVVLNYRNLQTVDVNYYLMDLEFLFSSDPFVGQDAGRFSMIKPNLSRSVALADDQSTRQFEIPSEFDGKNVLVEIIGSGSRKAKAYYSNTLDVQLVQNFGRVQVKDKSGQPLPKAYVKVYAKTAGKPKFYKDGYTDLRGKFDYTSLNTNELDSVSQFSVLVMHEEHGATVEEARPPVR